MTQAKKVAGGLQISEDRSWQEKFWTAQRVAWAVMALFILAAIAGLTGKGGPLASATARMGDAVVDYPAITRWQSDEQVQFHLADSDPDRVDILLSPHFVHLFAINSIEPEPSEVKATGAGHRFTFETEAGARGRTITFDVRAQKPAIAQRIQAAVGNRPAAELKITVLP
ncbi:MAG TPA: hypothetical protein VFO51_09030 [Sphingomicrobium sp.]|nr:hypothetical protein [Sphingomicrobium sp.]